MTDYPHHPGAYRVDTAIAAADFIAPSVPHLQKQILDVLTDVGQAGATGDEIAARLGWERFRVRPRTSELRLKKAIVDSGMRRKSDAGISSIVWVLPAYHRQEAANG
ncbi:hypothetical protein [Sphingobium chlorophenolicum]|uniref:Uncharacterized protein n=1 Tax=Sphingobium chlorophenolicum TaxID=46429 RepID=A0A081RCZ2_SPHCR|nr:hypothetical protein [Sphingobium chlorophenolicum]KEQ53065.1 hypothetical protein BV95_02721 [Sphingobium chlorophenolicum]